MKIKWPENLIEDLASRRCIIFIGSGISATSTNIDGDRPKIWGEFLRLAADLISDLQHHNDVVDLIDKKQYLLALQTIYNNCDQGRYQYFLEQEFNRKNFEPSDIHNLINEIDPKIVVTTNFDRIYDKTCNEDGYSIIKYNDSENLCDQIRSENRLIIKAHGDINSIKDIVFTRKQYFKAREKYSNFYKILEAIFMTNTLIFLGYSLEDPDIQLLLENVFITSQSQKPHYLVKLCETSSITKQDWKEHYNVEILEYGPKYEDLYDNIKELKELVIGERASRGTV